MGNACSANQASTPAPAQAARPKRRPRPSTPFVYARATTGTTAGSSPSSADEAGEETDSAPVSSRRGEEACGVAPLPTRGPRRRRRSIQQAEPGASSRAHIASRPRRRSSRRGSEHAIEEEVSSLLDAAVAAVATVEAGLAEPLSPQSARVQLRRRPSLGSAFAAARTMAARAAAAGRAVDDTTADVATAKAAAVAAAAPSAPAPRRRSNSTSTLFVSHTMWMPDDRATLGGIAALVLQRMRAPGAPAPSGPHGAAFEPTRHQLRRMPFEVATSMRSRMPTRAEVFAFLSHLHVEAQLSPEVPIMALVYLERMLKRADGLELTPSNWRHLVFASVLLGSKIWDDLSMTNGSFAIVSPHGMFRLRDVNRLEVACLSLLDYDVMVHGSVYARHYFRLRDTGASREGGAAGAGSTLPTRPLDRRSASVLELEGLVLGHSDSETPGGSPRHPADHASSAHTLRPVRMRRLASVDGSTYQSHPAMAILS